jgi:hypothetical protein
MKIVFALFVSFVLLSYFSYSQEIKDETKVITVAYSNEIHGYSITSIWKPGSVVNKHVVGPAIIEFRSKKDSTSFTLTTNTFSILKSKLPFSFSTDGLEIVKLNQKYLRLAYN